MRGAKRPGRRSRHGPPRTGFARDRARARGYRRPPAGGFDPDDLGPDEIPAAGFRIGAVYHPPDFDDPTDSPDNRDDDRSLT